MEGEWGCEEEDFTGMIDGQMALLSTNGNCSIATKIENSIAANAGAILIYNSVSYLGPYQGFFILFFFSLNLNSIFILCKFL